MPITPGIYKLNVWVKFRNQKSSPDLSTSLAAYHVLKLLLSEIITHYKEKEKVSEPPAIILERTLSILDKQYSDEFLRIRSGALAVSLCLQGGS